MNPRTRRRALAAAATGLLAVAGAVIGVVTALPAAASPTICTQFGSATVAGGRYVVQNNSWGDTTTQCIDVNQTGPGFTVTTASHNRPQNGAPGAYPSIYYGCHYANCSSGSGLPVQANTATFSNLNTSVTMAYPGSGVYDAAYDIWFDPTPRTDGQNTGAEIMVWLNHTGSVQPVGSQVGTATINGATWAVWEGNIGWNVVSYVRTATTNSLSFRVDDFYGDAVNRGYGQRSWYLTSIQAGFEPWVGQTGLAVTAFSVGNTGGGGGDTQPPSTPGQPSTSGVTASAVTLSWGASTDNVGVTGYDVVRAPGASGGTFTSVGSSTGTSFTNSGLSASTTYRYQVRARDAAGNTSAYSAPVTVTTSASGGGGGGGACSASYHIVNAWSGGFQADVTVTNTSSSASHGWTSTVAFQSGATVTQLWSATYTQSGNTVTAANVSYNASLAPGAAATFGFTANTSGSAGTPATVSCSIS